MPNLTSNTGYWNFNVNNVFDNPSLSSYALSETPLRFVFNKYREEYYSSDYVLWDFGDGSPKYKGLSAEHYYYYPGEYKVTCNLMLSSSTSVINTFSKTVTIKDFIPNTFAFRGDTAALFLTAGIFSDLLTVDRFNSLQSYGSGYSFFLNASGSNSLYYDRTKAEKEPYSFLLPTHRFVQRKVVGNFLSDTIIDKLSTSESRVLISGPTGSGKELVARKIHLISNRKNKKFNIINGALLNSEKYEKELFGEEAPDGSIIYGALEKSSGGILLIDEVTEIPLETQSKILRVLIDQKFKRINGKHDINVNVRIICSTNKDLQYEIQIGNFREDLFHRLNVFNIKLEPLNQRYNDIPLLVEYFMEKLSEVYNIKKIEIKDYNFLLNYDWPGNVRELRNLVERIIILSPGQNQDKINEIIKESLAKSSSKEFNISENLSFTLREARENFEREYLSSQLKKFSGNISKTAKFVGMERSALHRKLKLLGIKEFN